MMKDTKSKVKLVLATCFRELQRITLESSRPEFESKTQHLLAVCSQSNLKNKNLLKLHHYHHYPVEETGAQRIKAICLRSQS